MKWWPLHAAKPISDDAVAQSVKALEDARRERKTAFERVMKAISSISVDQGIEAIGEDIRSADHHEK